MTNHQDPVLVLRQQQTNDLLEQQQRELWAVEQRQAESLSHFRALQASERDAVKERHREELAALNEVQDRHLPLVVLPAAWKEVARGRA